MKSVTNRHSDWALYRRLLSYVARYSGVFLLSIFGFTLYSGANVLLADLTQFLLDSLGEAPQIDIGVVSKISYWIWPQGDKSTLDYARVAVPMAAIALAFIRATGYFLGNYFMNIVARGVVHRLRTQVFDVLIRVPKVAIDPYSHGELVSKLTFHV